ncbi:MAG: hypothetical protein ACYTXY_23560, partial [Nostoc sp.]
RVIDDCHAGQITIDYQPGHPHGFVSSIYMGEIAICQVLDDPDSVLEALKFKTKPYPVGLKHATIDTFAWEISFSLVVAKKAIARDDVVYAAGCCFRSVACMNQVLFTLNEDYLLNEKGAVAIAMFCARADRCECDRSNYLDLTSYSQDMVIISSFCYVLNSRFFATCAC